MSPDAIEAIRITVAEATKPTLLVEIYYLSSVILAVAAIVALAFAAMQVREANQANQNALTAASEAARFQKGRFLFLIDQTFESSLDEARTLFFKESTKIEQEVSEEQGHRPLEDQTAAFRERFSKRLFTMRETEPRTTPS